MSYVIATPEMMATAAFDLARIGSQVSAASAVAAMPTTEVVAAGADEVSAGIAALFSAHAQEYQALSAQAAAFHDQFVHTLTAAARWYTATEIANAAAMRVVLGAVNAPTQTLLGRPLIGDGAHGTAPGQPGGAGGLLFGNGGNGAAGAVGQVGGAGGAAGLFGIGGAGGAVRAGCCSATAVTGAPAVPAASAARVPRAAPEARAALAWSAVTAATVVPAAPAATAARAVPEVPAEVPECSASQVSTVRAVPGAREVPAALAARVAPRELGQSSRATPVIPAVSAPPVRTAYPAKTLRRATRTGHRPSGSPAHRPAATPAPGHAVRYRSATPRPTRPG